MDDRLEADAPDATATIATEIADGLLRRRPDHHCLSSSTQMYHSMPTDLKQLHEDAAKAQHEVTRITSTLSKLTFQHKQNVFEFVNNIRAVN